MEQVQISLQQNGQVVTLQESQVRQLLERVCERARVQVPIEPIITAFYKNTAAQLTTAQLYEALILSSCPFIERDPAYDKITTQLLLEKSYQVVLGINSWHEEFAARYRQALVHLIQKGVQADHLDQRCLHVDAQELAQALVLDRDQDFYYLGLETLSQRYFIQLHGKLAELPQHFWMRVALGLSLLEKEPEKVAKTFYEAISQFKYSPGTPTLLHSALKRPQLSSCFGVYVGDDLHHIFKALGDIAQLSKWSGGVVSDWSAIRATGSPIKSINVESQGLIPFLKIANDVTCAINRSGKRRSATVVSVECWHADFEDFCDLRKNTGDERRRAHDMNIAAWVPDLFMKRVRDNAQWSLFSPDEVPDLHELYGAAFEERYVHYEQLGEQGKLSIYRKVQAQELWRRMLTRLFETGFPWITFKDPCNIRSPQDHVGVVHSSNLCTEITLNTSPDETFVCNLGSVNIAAHIVDQKIDEQAFAQTVKTAMRMLDNVIDINFYPVKEAQTANVRHRPIGLGIMGFQDALFMMDIPFDDPRAREFADYITELYSYHAILGSAELAKERGMYSTYKGSKWDRGLLPVDTIDLLEQQRGEKIDIDRQQKLDWQPVRDAIKAYGMRNSNTMAIAPTATISNITGCYPCIEPIYSNMYVKSNMSGEFTVVNRYLINDLKQEGLWSDTMLQALKALDGNIQDLAIIPAHIRAKYKTAFELDPEWMVAITASRSKWIDQSISHNVFMRGVSGKKMSDIAFAAWTKGMKTMYYWRTLAASRTEKVTVDTEVLKKLQIELTVSRKACAIENPDCESCQ